MFGDEGYPWTVDALSGVGVPANATEWAAAMAAAGIASGGPSALWLCQDASGNAADAIGTYTGTASGTGTAYRQPVAGWSRLALTTTDAASGAWANTAAGLPDPATTSCMALAYLNLPTAPGAGRALLRIGTGGVTASLSGSIASSNVPRITITNGTIGSNGTSNPFGTSVRPWLLQHNITAATQTLYTDQEKLPLGSPQALTGVQIRMGMGVTSAPAASYLNCAWFFGAAAELSAAQIKRLLQTLAWSVLW